MKRRTRTVIECEQCGNEFKRGQLVKKDDKEFIQCPYCRYLNTRRYKKRKNRRGTK